MALTDVQLKLDACFSDGCSTLEIYDNTLPYDASTNQGGWAGGPTFDNQNVTLATLSYKHASETTFNVVDITTDLTAVNVTGKFLLLEETISTGDGLYTFVYHTEDSNTSQENTITVYSYNLCGVRCCIDKMWLKVIDSDCDCGCEDEELLAKIQKAEALYRAIKSIGGCGDVTLADKYLAKLQRLCALEKCNCGN